MLKLIRTTKYTVSLYFFYSTNGRDFAGRFTVNYIQRYIDQIYLGGGKMYTLVCTHNIKRKFLRNIFILYVNFMFVEGLERPHRHSLIYVIGYYIRVVYYDDAHSHQTTCVCSVVK